MNRTKYFIVVAVAVLIGLKISPHNLMNPLLGGLVAFMAVELFTLRRRLDDLEARWSTQQAKTPNDTAEAPAFEEDQAATKQEYPAEESTAIPPHPVFAPSAPLTTASPPPREETAATPQPAAGLLPTLVAKMLNFFTSGNLVLKIGTVILFFGVAFLLKYAAQRNLIPIEFRLIAVTGGGLALLIIGWLLRRQHNGYGLGLEGAGIGILYLVIFASAKLYHLIPMPFALAMMIGLVAFSCALAVMQESRGLAVSGSIGGFLAPVLMSTGAGNHVLLFSYYGLLNSGILGISWFKAWRELNLVGFVFTFAIATLWGASAYTPAHFATTEPFLILFFLMYTFISVLFALRQPLQLRGFVDGPLVFGLPIVTAGLQACMVREFRYGMALSALTLGFFYAGLAQALWKRLTHQMRLLTESFLALGVVFGSLAIPLGLDPRWTTAAWAMEGAAMIWIGLRQNRKLARLFGMLLQAGAALMFIGNVHHPLDSILFGNHFFLGCGLIAAAALFTSYQFSLHEEQCRPWEKRLPLVFLAWGLIWWYFGGIRELDRHFLSTPNVIAPAILLFTVFSTTIAGVFTWRLRWPLGGRALLLLLPIMLLTLIAQTAHWNHGPLLFSYGWLAWPLAFLLQYGLLAIFADDLPRPALPVWHILTLWTLILSVTIESAWRVNQISSLAPAWSSACWGLAPAAFLFALEFRGDRLQWPVRCFAQIYHGVGSGIPVLATALWCLFSFQYTANPAPLPYFPLLNPLELAEFAAIILGASRIVRRARFPKVEPDLLFKAPLAWRLIAGLTFFWLTTLCARCVHVYFNVPYTLHSLFASTIFQATIAALWSLLALAMTIGGAKRGRRDIWFMGASLLGLVVLKLFLIDLSGTGSVARIVSFIVVGLLMLVIGFFAPLPPQNPPSEEAQ